ncbi:hypothetical protein FB645_005591 [Coemansia sp. IMI 203386]|nr:hypothetical protein FB645_005591 [Coemansia sp. IMI 203386]
MLFVSHLLVLFIILHKYGVQVEDPPTYPIRLVELNLDLDLEPKLELEPELLLGQNGTFKAAVALIVIILAALVVCNTPVLAIRICHGTLGVFRACAAYISRRRGIVVHLDKSHLDTAQEMRMATGNDNDNNYSAPAADTRVCRAPAVAAKRQPAFSATRHGKAISIDRLLPKPAAVLHASGAPAGSAELIRIALMKPAAKPKVAGSEAPLFAQRRDESVAIDQPMAKPAAVFHVSGTPAGSLELIQIALMKPAAKPKVAGSKALLFAKRRDKSVAVVTTGIVGIPVNPNARPQLIALYKKTLDELKAKIPESAAYRQSVETITKQRLSIVEQHEDAARIEELINCGQIEELVDQAQDEIGLISRMAEWKAWEPLEEPAPPRQWEYFKKAPATE